MYMFGHNYTKIDNEEDRPVSPRNHCAFNSYRWRLIKVCFARDSSTCHGLATGDVDFHNSKQHFAKFGVQKKTSVSWFKQ